LIGNFWSKGKREPVYVEPEDIDALIEYLEKAKKEVKA
jgi:Holliday junction resolvase